MNKETSSEISLSAIMFARMGARQIKLIEKIGDTIKDANSLKPRLRLSSLDVTDSSLAILQDDAIALDKMFDQPGELLLNKEEITQVDKNPFIMFDFLRRASQGQLVMGRMRIFSLLEHLERRLASKRESVYINRTLLLSSTVIILVLISLVVTITLAFTIN